MVLLNPTNADEFLKFFKANMKVFLAKHPKAVGLFG